MSKYTLELRYIYEDENYNLFDFPYNLYDNDLKPWFEEKFFQHFMFYEIGFYSVAMFKQRLISNLNEETNEKQNLDLKKEDQDNE